MAFNSESAKKAGEKSSRKGIGSKFSAQIRHRISQIVEHGLESFESDLSTLSPKERLQIMVKLIDFTVPKIKAIEIDLNDILDSREQKLIEALEHDKERQQVLMRKLAEARAARARLEDEV